MDALNKGLSLRKQMVMDALDMGLLPRKQMVMDDLIPLDISSTQDHKEPKSLDSR